MIQDIKIKNCLSFKNEAVFSFEATKDTTLEDSLIVEVAPGVRLLRFAMIMGANGSGKSNLLMCFNFLNIFWNNKTDDLEESTTACPFLLDSVTKEKPCELETRFWINGVKYHYIVKVDSTKTYEEKLFFYKTVQPSLVFKRELLDDHSVITFNPALKVSNAVIDELQVRCLNNMSVLAARGKINASIPYLDDVREWAKTSIMNVVTPEIKLFEYCKDSIHHDADVRNYILDYLHSTNFNITNLITDDVFNVDEKYRKALGVMLTTMDAPKEVADSLTSDEAFHKITMQFIHQVTNEHGTEEYPLSASLESYGTRRSMGIETALYMAQRRNALMPIDEFDTSMHPNLMEYCIRRFLKDNSSSQLLITTHYDPFLATIDSLIRKDCVWFTEKDPDGASNLYPLVEFKGLNKMTSILKNYRNGFFGALPEYNNNINEEGEV